MLADIDPAHAPRLTVENRRVSLAPSIDAALGGGLVCGALHELAPTAPVHLGVASGFAAAVAARASLGRTSLGRTSLGRREILWIATDYAAAEGGGPYGPGLDLFGLASAHLLMLRVAKPVDVLWAMEEALRCRALACVIAEFTSDGAMADLTATRRLTLAAREGLSAQTSGFGLLIRHKTTAMPSAAATRWEIASALSEPDALARRSGGLGRARFDLSLRKNRCGPAGRWIIEWNHHERIFEQAVPVAMAAETFDRSDRASLVRTG
jgi:protein ImuA